MSIYLRFFKVFVESGFNSVAQASLKLVATIILSNLLNSGLIVMSRQAELSCDLSFLSACVYEVNRCVYVVFTCAHMPVWYQDAFRCHSSGIVSFGFWRQYLKWGGLLDLSQAGCEAALGVCLSVGSPCPQVHATKPYTLMYVLGNACTASTVLPKLSPSPQLMVLIPQHCFFCSWIGLEGPSLLGCVFPIKSHSPESFRGISQAG